jgi:hypothetical protein
VSKPHTSFTQERRLRTLVICNAGSPRFSTSSSTPDIALLGVRLDHGLYIPGGISFTDSGAGRTRTNHEFVPMFGISEIRISHFSFVFPVRAESGYAILIA